jgi:tetratricopeptide (TPR) repeat protein
MAYYLGREQEALLDSKLAVQSYCRYLALAPNATDADEVRGRIVRLTPADEIARQDEAEVVFKSGLVLLKHGDYAGADSLLSLTTDMVPSAPAAIYNRALARAARGARDSATADFRRYIALTPGGSDHAAIAIALQALPPHVYDPGRALTAGMLFPGMGQFRTGRPVLGSLALGAMAGALSVALRWQLERQIVVRRDPQGKPYVDSLDVAVSPTAVVGYSAAAAVWVGAALESFWYARKTHAQSAAIISRRDSGAAKLVMQALGGGRTGVGVGVRWR